MKQQKSELFDKLIPFFVQTTKVFEKEKLQCHQRFNNKVFKAQLGEKRDEVHLVYSKDVKVYELSLFSSTTLSQFWTLSENLLQSETS